MSFNVEKVHYSVYVVGVKYAEFKRGRTSLGDGPREGCPKTATPETVEKVGYIIWFLTIVEIKVHEIAEAIGIS